MYAVFIFVALVPWLLIAYNYTMYYVLLYPPVSCITPSSLGTINPSTLYPPVSCSYSVLAWDKGSDAILVLGSLLGIVIFYFGAAWIVTSVDKCALRRAAAAQRSTTTASAPSSKTPSSLWFCPVTDFVDSPEAAAWTCRSVIECPYRVFEKLF